MQHNCDLLILFLLMVQMSPSSTSPASVLIELLCHWPLVGSIAGGEVCFVTLKTNWPKKSFVAFSDFHNSIELILSTRHLFAIIPRGKGYKPHIPPKFPQHQHQRQEPIFCENTKRKFVRDHSKNCAAAQRVQKSSLAPPFYRFKRVTVIKFSLV